jgi:hypothetical protein
MGISAVMVRIIEPVFGGRHGSRLGFGGCSAMMVIDKQGLGVEQDYPVKIVETLLHLAVYSAALRLVDTLPFCLYTRTSMT